MTTTDARPSTVPVTGLPINDPDLRGLGPGRSRP